MSDIGTSQMNFAHGHESPVGIDAVAKSMNQSRTRLNSKSRHAIFVSKLRDGNPPTIYRVPQSIRQLNEDAYEPRILSIGPYHHGKKHLQGMEEHKWLYLDSILSRNRRYSLKDYIEAIAKFEDEARSCYSDYVGYKGEEFVEMMVLDGCFIVEFFLKLKEAEPCEVDPVFSMSWMLVVIGYDMLLLENQIPFLVLQLIFEMVKPVDKPFKYSLVELTLDFFFNFFHEIMPSIDKFLMMYSVLPDHHHHLLHLFHSQLILPTFNKQSNLPCNSTIESVTNKSKNLLMSFRSKFFGPSSNKDELPISDHQSPPLRPPVTMKMIPGAVELQLAGVKFKKKGEWSSILEVKFSNGMLEIPPLSINSYTGTLFRNLLMFERCYPKARICFTTYIIFMDCIINTSEDVELLHRNGIIDHLMGSNKEVARLFNQLGYGIFDFQNNYLSGLYKDVEEHCNTEWNMWWASLRRDYFTSPWAGLSSIAAVIIILATITQTLFAILSYFQPRSSS